jgi:hypothetical protein
MIIIIYYIITVHYSTQWHRNTKGKLQPMQEQEEQQLEPLLHQILHLYLTTWQAGILKLQGQIIHSAVPARLGLKAVALAWPKAAPAF